MIRIDIRKRLLSEYSEFILDIKADIQKGQLTALFGPSGAGKTTLLRIMAGLMKPDTGLLQFDQDIWFDAVQSIFKTPQQRKVGMVFQETALFPNMSVKANLNFAISSTHDREYLDELSQLTQIEALFKRMPEQLSRGEKQRVAMARALVRKPGLLLLDEPFSALDFSMRKKMQDMIKEIHKKFGLTTIIVSHDIAEVYRLADQLILIDAGKVNETGKPSEIFGHQKLSGKFQFAGQIISIRREDIMMIVTILVENQLIQVAADPSELEGILEGDKVIVASKAFNPIIQKIESS